MRLSRLRETPGWGGSGSGKSLPRPPDAISIDKPLNKADLPKGSRISKDGRSAHYSDKERARLDKIRSGQSTGRTRVGPLARLRGIINN